MVVHRDDEAKSLFLAADALAPRRAEEAGGFSLQFAEGPATIERPLRRFFRLPQEGQDFNAIAAGLHDPDRLLREARAYWQKWQPFEGDVKWSLPGRYGEFLTACARNIQEAREVRAGRVIFKSVGDGEVSSEK